MTFKCSCCDYETTQVREYKSHLSSGIHKINRDKSSHDLNININLNLNSEKRGVNIIPNSNLFNGGSNIGDSGDGQNTVAGCFHNTKKIINEWYCDLCKITCNSKEKYAEHTRGKKHTSKQKELYTENLPCGRRIDRNDVHIDSSHSNGPYNRIGNMDIYICEHCSVYCNSSHTLENHMRGKNHLKNLNRIKNCGASFCEQKNNTKKICREDISVVKTTDITVSPPCYEFMDQIKQKILYEKQIGKQKGYFCSVCDMFCNSIDSACDHIMGKKHVKKYASFCGKNLVQGNNQSVGCGEIDKQDTDYKNSFDESRSVQILEYCWEQCFGQHTKPVYIEKSYGPSHCMEFTCDIDMKVFGMPLIQGKGKTKKQAKKDACVLACQMLDKAKILKKAIQSDIFFH